MVASSMIVTVSHRSPVALYWQAAEILRDRITSGEYRPGQRLPAETRLQAELGIGRYALHHAIAMLRIEGLVTYRAGDGNRVRAQHRHLEQLRPAPGTVVAIRMPTPDERVQLGLPEGAPVFVIDGQPYPGSRFVLCT